MPTSTAQLIDGKAIAASIREDLAARTARLSGVRAPGLAVVQVGEDPASSVYVRSKKKACEEVGFASLAHHLPVDISEVELLELINSLNSDPRVDGILVQLPLPGHIDKTRVLNAIDPSKDVDGFHPVSIGKLLLGEPTFRACTPAGIMELLARTGVKLSGKHAVVVGRSNIVGKPIAVMLLNADATVTICHSRTPDLGEFCRQADVVIAAVGRENLIRGDMLKPGAIVIDVGMNRNAEGKLVGDVDFASASAVAGWITPVPGGVGPMTIAMLLANTWQSYEAREQAR